MHGLGVMVMSFAKFNAAPMFLEHRNFTSFPSVNVLSSGVCASRRSFNPVLLMQSGTCAPSCSGEDEYIFAKSVNWKTIGLGAFSIYTTSSAKGIASKET